MESTRTFVVISELRGSGEALVGLVPDHLRYMERIESDGAIAISGPFLEADGTVATTGLTILRAGNRDEAERLAAEDPFHRSGVRSFTLRELRVDQGRLADH